MKPLYKQWEVWLIFAICLLWYSTLLFDLGFVAGQQNVTDSSFPLTVLQIQPCKIEYRYGNETIASVPCPQSEIVATGTIEGFANNLDIGTCVFPGFTENKLHYPICPVTTSTCAVQSNGQCVLTNDAANKMQSFHCNGSNCNKLSRP